MSAGNVIATKFEDIRTGEISWGIRIYDEYETYYSNIMEESEVKTDDDIALLKLAKENYEQNSDGGDFFKSVAEMESGININDTYYDWDEISSVFEKGE